MSSKRVDMNKYRKCMKQRKSQKSKKGSLCDRGYCTAKTIFKKYPSARANAYASQVCSGKRSDVTKKKRTSLKKGKKRTRQANDLSRWHREKWVDVCRRGKNGKHPPCGNRLGTKGYPYCRPSKRISSRTPVLASQLSAAQKRSLCQKKRKNPSKKSKSLKR